ncbi:HAD family hydrolase [Bacillus sp. 165]|uniref:HAD family hydrolase n=1 Tax=Bacillus sp. 165 TaxID=1529117 RepID=UPI001ADBC95B|nr:HAD family hydrolase [Bacillus sp. 165]MBO9130778.1 HAD family hydrolase [Bacillus sp. 165]
MYNFILFDLDGTLTDPKDGIINSVQYALAKMGIKEQDSNVLLEFIGPPIQDSFAQLYGFNQEQISTAVAYYREYFKVTGMFQNEVYPGILELLQSLRREGKTLIVATSKPTVFAERILEHFALDKYFSKIIGSNLDGTRTAKTDIINHILLQYPNSETTEFIMIGDRKHDIIGAKNMLVHSVGVTWGYGSITELESIKPTHIVKSVSELYRLLGTKNLVQQS